jgi:hypothetical protein
MVMEEIASLEAPQISDFANGVGIGLAIGAAIGIAIVVGC